MDILALGEGVSLTAAAAQTAKQPANTPLLPGFEAIAAVNLDGATGTPTVKIEGSDDGGTTWTELLTITDLNALKLAKITLHADMRLNVSVVGSAGKVSAYLLGSL